MLEQHKYSHISLAENVLPPVTEYRVIYSNRPRVDDISLLLQGISTISHVSYAAKEHTPSIDISNIETTHQMTGLLTAISHYHHISHMDRSITTENELIAWERHMQYIADLPDNAFWGGQKRAVGVAKRAALKASTQQHHVNTYLHALQKYIYGLDTALANDEGPYATHTQRQIPIMLNKPEEIDLRRNLFPIILHDLNGSISALGLWQDLETDTGPSNRRRSTYGTSIAWQNLFETSLRAAKLIEQPYARDTKPTAYWEEETTKAAKALLQKYSTLEVVVGQSVTYGEVTWSREWLKALVDNIGQNVLRIWPDAMAKGLDQTKGMSAHPVLEIETESSGEDFVISFHDNGTGFTEDYLSHGFSGQHNYRSHRNSTGTAMKTLSHMIRVYGGNIIVANRYQRKDGTIFVSPDPNFLDDPSLRIEGGTIKVKLPKKA